MVYFERTSYGKIRSNTLPYNRLSMRNTMKKIFFMLALSCAFLCADGGSFVFANNLSITNVTLEDRDSSLDTAIVEFDISWDNSWRSTTNHDAVWVFFKVYAAATTAIYHGKMKDAGVDPSGTSPGSNKDLEIEVPSDKMGAFIRRKSTGTGTVTSKDVRLKLDYAASPLSGTDSASITVNIKGVEMVYIPTGAFWAGDTYVGNSRLRAGSTTSAPDTNPWYISSESTITTTSPGNGNTYYYVTSGRPNEDATGAIFSLGTTFPKGYAAFYCMKYELTEGQWVDFVNSLTTLQKSQVDITANHFERGGKNSDSVLQRNTVSQSGGTASTLRPDRAMTYISFQDLCAYLDWAGLRPMTELEFEKIARGPLSPVSQEYAWGSSSATNAVTFSGSPENGLETFVTSGANVAVLSQTWSRGDDYLGAEYANGPVRVGIFATSSSTRSQAGASYYGVMEMTGNLWEFAVTVGNSAGRAFTGGHGDGVLTTASGYEGNANVTGWPHTDAGDSSRGVTGSAGSSFRGGSDLRAVSDRGIGAYWDDNRWGGAGGFQGGRGVRTYTGSAF